MKNEPTLVILTPGFARNEEDSTCLPMQQNLVRAINRLYPQYRVVILAFQYPYTNASYTWSGNSVVNFNGQNRGGLSRLLLRRRVYRQLEEIHRTSMIVGLLSFWYGECAVVGANFAAQHGLKHFCWILGQDARRENKYPRRHKLRGDQLLALSDFLQTAMEKNHGIKPALVLPPGVEADNGTGNNVRDIDLLGVGSLIPIKQYDHFIQVVAKLKARLPGLRAVLVGDGPERKNLRSLISESGLGDTVFLAGELGHPAALQMMRRSKILLHPSSYEGFGMVIIEALQAGCHVISYTKAMNESIQHWHTVDAEDEMTATALRLLKDENTEHRPVLFANIDDTAKKIMALYK